MNISKMSRRKVLGLGLASTLAGCASRDPVMSNAFSVARYLFAGRPDQKIDRETVAKIPYATVSAKIGKAGRTLLVLGQRQRNDLFWVSADNAGLITRFGRLVKTVGLVENLIATEPLVPDPLQRNPHRLAGQLDSSRIVDLDAGNGYETYRIDAMMAPMGPETITIAGLDFKTLKIREVNRAVTVRWKFVNFFWVDIYDGFVWKSRQHFTRGLPPVDLEVLKPAA